MRNLVIAILLAVGIVALVLVLNAGRGDGTTVRTDVSSDAVTELVAVSVPELDGQAAEGRLVYVANCAGCHGPNAGGLEGAGPPLVHKIYEPSHHGDMAFYLAAVQGVRAHHWDYGDMPPVTGVTEAEVASIVSFVRALQRENGIE
ncbi:cytochrome c [Maritimibacter sp. DP1N21-5]|uniref:c-type cytochrome n=1 Tax=Maritimibacter sp. DP1N21-5 TaxID=2836867 RepID=UPI001C487410|nr:cytochrome c [Maritimibacter sp. DP1N21-5]MBV7409406.1 cytochrome c [Maritimibacter sp. DP1N21-5]